MILLAKIPNNRNNYFNGFVNDPFIIIAYQRVHLNNKIQMELVSNNLLIKILWIL